MVIIKVNRKLLKLLAVVAAAACIGLGINTYIARSGQVKESGEQTYAATSFDNIDLVYFIASASEEDYKYIEIFDIGKGEVEKKVKLSPAVQAEVKNYLQRITGMYVKAEAFPDKGHIIKVPLEPSVKVNNQWLIDYGIRSVEEVFILFPQDGEPYLLVLDDKNRPFFYNFDANTNVLLEKLEVQTDSLKTGFIINNS